MKMCPLHLFFSPLRNKYYLLRHGYSEAMAQGIIVSTLHTGKDAYGLTSLGRRQVLRSALAAKRKKIIEKETVLYASPLQRTKETAELVAAVFNILKKKIHWSNSLRERDFGRLHLKKSIWYQKVWERDFRDPTHHWAGVESIQEVAQRVFSLLQRLEKKHAHKKILLVSHEDVLHVLQALAAGKNIAHHRKLKKIRPGELRELTVFL